MGIEKIDDILQEYEEGLKRSLICASSQDMQKHLSETVKDLKYSADIALNPEEAFERLRFNQYDLIIIDENFGDRGIEGNEFLHHIQNLSMSTRRFIFIALYGAAFKTMDNMAAFERSVNLVVNVKDIANVRVILKKSIGDNDQFYKVFRESLQKFGKA